MHLLNLLRRLILSAQLTRARCLHNPNFPLRESGSLLRFSGTVSWFGESIEPLRDQWLSISRLSLF